MRLESIKFVCPTGCWPGGIESLDWRDFPI